MKKMIIVIGTLCALIFFVQAAEVRCARPGETSPTSTVGIDDAKALLEQGAVFVDVRSVEEYHTRHIESAVLISKEELDGDLLQIIYTDSRLWEECDCDGNWKRKDAAGIDCIVYGSESDVETQEKAAVRLREEGVKNVFIMSEGFDAWLKAGYYTEEGLTFRADEHSVVFFFIPGCSNCLWAKKKLEKMFGGTQVRVIEKNIALEENRRLRQMYDAMYSVSDEQRGVVPAVFRGSVALVGKDDIKKKYTAFLTKPPLFNVWIRHYPTERTTALFFHDSVNSNRFRSLLPDFLTG